MGKKHVGVATLILDLLQDPGHKAMIRGSPDIKVK